MLETVTALGAIVGLGWLASKSQDKKTPNHKARRNNVAQQHNPRNHKRDSMTLPDSKYLMSIELTKGNYTPETLLKERLNTYYYQFERKFVLTNEVSRSQFDYLKSSTQEDFDRFEKVLVIAANLAGTFEGKRYYETRTPTQIRALLLSAQSIPKTKTYYFNMHDKAEKLLLSFWDWIISGNKPYNFDQLCRDFKIFAYHDKQINPILVNHLIQASNYYPTAEKVVQELRKHDIVWYETTPERLAREAEEKRKQEPTIRPVHAPIRNLQPTSTATAVQPTTVTSRSMNDPKYPDFNVDEKDLFKVY